MHILVFIIKAGNPTTRTPQRHNKAGCVMKQSHPTVIGKIKERRAKLTSDSDFAVGRRKNVTVQFSK